MQTYFLMNITLYHINKLQLTNYILNPMNYCSVKKRDGLYMTCWVTLNRELLDLLGSSVNAKVTIFVVLWEDFHFKMDQNME